MEASRAATKPVDDLPPIRDMSSASDRAAVSQAKVKSVTSGDTLVLTSLHSPEQERILSLAYVSAPRLRREGDEVSEPLNISLLDIKAMIAFCIPFS